MRTSNKNGDCAFAGSPSGAAKVQICNACAWCALCTLGRFFVADVQRPCRKCSVHTGRTTRATMDLQRPRRNSHLSTAFLPGEAPLATPCVQHFVASDYCFENIVFGYTWDQDHEYWVFMACPSFTAVDPMCIGIHFTIFIFLLVHIFSPSPIFFFFFE